MKYFRMTDDVDAPDRWFLGSPIDANGESVDPELFRVCKKIAVTSPLTVGLRRPGRPLEFTYADFDMPVATRRAASILHSVASGLFDSFPARVVGVGGEFEIINVLESRRCIDESRSEFLKWNESDERPDKLGQYRQITRLRIDPTKVGGLGIFRVEGWKIALIVAERVKDAFERNRIDGVKFASVG